MRVGDSALSLLWDKWKACDANVYDRYNRFWALQIALTGWILFVSRDGIAEGELKSGAILLFLVSLVGFYVVRLMKTDLMVRNAHNPEIILALEERGVLQGYSSEQSALLCESWTPENFSHKWNNWHACSSKTWASALEVKTMRGTTTTMRVVYILCSIDLILAVSMVALNFTQFEERGVW